MIAIKLCRLAFPMYLLCVCLLLSKMEGIDSLYGAEFTT